MNTELSTAKNKLMIGIDGGGSKTEFCLFSEDGSILKRLQLGGTNPNVYGPDKALDTLKCGIDLVCDGYPDVTATFAGIAGCANRKNATVISDFLKNHYPQMQTDVGGDSINSIYSTQYSDRCIAVIVGTGSVIFVKDGESIARIGGWGYLLDEGYNGFYLGTEVLRAVMAEEDGIGDATVLTEKIEKRLGKRAVDGFDEIYALSKDEIAAFARLLFDAYDEGDNVALGIIKKNLDLLSQRLCNVIKMHPECGKRIIMTGGLANRRDILTKGLKIGDTSAVIFPELPPIYGACHYCVRKFGSPSADFYENFKNSYREIK